MELRKRSLPETFLVEKCKKKRKDLKRISELEDLPGEIWFELFDYFDGESLLNCFSQLNSFIQSFLNDFRLPIHLNISCFSFIVPSLFNSNQIISLNINYSQIDQNAIVDISSFIRLRSLGLISINDEQLEKVSKFSLINLRQISIESKCAKFLSKIVSIYFPNVNRMRLNSMGKEFIVKSFHSQKCENQIEKLKLNGTIKLAKLFRLWPFVPNLHSLQIINGGVHQCDYWMDQNTISDRKFPSNLSLIHIHIYDDDLSFSNLERLIAPTVCYLKVSGSMADEDLEDYLISTNWIQLMSLSSNKLRRIKLDLSSYFDPGDSSGLQKTLFQFRKNSFFHNTIIRSKNFHITIKGYLQPDQQ